MATHFLRPIKAAVNKTRCYGRLYDWCMHDNWWLGKYVELMGNQVMLDGSVFSLDNPSISTRVKSRFVLNQYEGAERYMIRHYLDPNLPVVELGGGIGVISCIVNKQLNDPYQHVVAEANPALVPLLLANRDLNRGQFTVLNRAYAYGKESVSLFLDGDFVTATLCRVSDRVVNTRAISLLELLSGFGFTRCTLICDIEGSEFNLLRNEFPLLLERVAMLIVEFHAEADGGDGVAAAIKQLRSAGFVQLDQQSRVYACRNSRLH